MSCLLLNRMLRLHIQFPWHLVTVIGEEIVIKRFHVAGNASADTSGMRREDGTNLRQFVVNIKSTKTTHPLIGMIDDLLRTIEAVVVIALHHQGCCIREHRGFVVITIGMKRINSILFPKPCIYFILLFKEWRKVHQDCDRITRNSPAPYPHFESLLLSHTLPISKERLILLEIRTFTFFPEIRTDKDNLILKYLL